MWHTCKYISTNKEFNGVINENKMKPATVNGKTNKSVDSGDML